MPLHGKGGIREMQGGEYEKYLLQMMLVQAIYS